MKITKISLTKNVDRRIKDERILKTELKCTISFLYKLTKFQFELNNLRN